MYRLRDLRGYVPVQRHHPVRLYRRRGEIRSASIMFAPSDDGGYKVQGKGKDQAETLLADAKALEAAGAVAVVLEAIRQGHQINQELIAIQDGYRESEQSWAELLLDVKTRGLSIEPKLATGDGALGFWAALPKVFPSTRGQRCWVHKTANVLNKLPKSVQPASRKRPTLLFKRMVPERNVPGGR